MAIKHGDVIQVAYTLWDDKGNLISSEDGGKEKQIKIQLGRGQVISGFEQKLIGMDKGEQKKFVLQPDEAYGEFNPLLVEKIPKDQLEGQVDLYLGKRIEIVAPNGMPSTAWIRLIEDNFVLVDMNPPLAGRALKFKVRIIETNLEPEPTVNPFLFGMSCGDSCEHEQTHGEENNH
jgi:FKBP-type peptidyl-prolyl cis-trans isomerase 2